jgi:ABC-type dipeptide/oligopeptide/nickel transport system permease subunit
MSAAVPAATGTDPEGAPTLDPTTTVPTNAELTPRREVWLRFLDNRLAVAGAIAIVLLVLLAVFAPLIATQDPLAVDPVNARHPPSAEHWFGTDQIGRDLFSRVVYGARVSLRIGIGAAAIATVLGVTAGLAAGYHRGRVDALVMRATDVLLAFPYILAAIAIISVIGAGERTVILVLGLLGWLPIARVLRASVLQVTNLEYVQAARALGAGDLRIMLRHVLPNAIQPVIVYATLFVGTAVLSEAALSFLAVGVQEPTPAWGLMVNQGRRFLASSPHLLFFPGAAIFLMVTAFVFVGDGLRDALDPRLQ